jgi:hypothetical protein
VHLDSASAENAVHKQALEATRQREEMRQEQNAAYDASLAQDLAKEAAKQEAAVEAVGVSSDGGSLAFAWGCGSAAVPHRIARVSAGLRCSCRVYSRVCMHVLCDMGWVGGYVHACACMRQWLRG